MRKDLIHTAGRPTRWWNQAPWSSNRLMRPSDRIWSSLVIAAVAIGTLAIPVAAAVGTSVYASGRARIEQQQHVDSQWSGTVSPDPVPGTKDMGAARKVVAWTMNGTARTEPLVAHFSARPGNTIAVWTNATGDQVPPPPQTSSTAVDGIAAAITLYCASVLAVHGILTAARTLISWRNGRAWDAEWSGAFPPHA